MSAAEVKIALEMHESGRGVVLLAVVVDTRRVPSDQLTVGEVMVALEDELGGGA